MKDQSNIKRSEKLTPSQLERLEQLVVERNKQGTRVCSRHYKPRRKSG